MERFRPLLPQTTYFLDPLQQFRGPPPSRKVSVGIDIAQQSVFGDSDSNSNISSGKNLSYTAANCQDEETKVFGGGCSYIKEWETICQAANIDEFRAWAFDGELSACRFRSVCWRVFLSILKPDSSTWLSDIRSKRENYESIRHELMVTPGVTSESLDPSINNPLSQDEESPWNQFFEDSNLKRLIRLDVQRTFPEVDFFQTKRIQEMLVSILFCYARKYPKITYIQGMHEVLAPIAFVLNYDQHVFTHSNKDEASSKLLQEIMDEAYLEHDSYTLFEAVMEKMHQWYEDGEPKSRLIAHKCKTLPTQPFARPQDIGPTTKIVQRLTRVHDHLVKTHEPEIYGHLNRLEIPPQVYGIRWVRLMFGREFSFTDLLMVWDAIFADNYSNFLLIEYLIVAMLSYIKDQLLIADYTSSLSLLMRFPPASDVQSIIHTALYFRNPKGFNIPGKCGNVPANLTTVGGQPNVHRSPQAVAQSRHGVTRSASLPRPSTAHSASFKQRSPSVDHQNKSSNGPDRRKSPTVETSGTFSGMTYSATTKTNPDEESKHGEQANSATTKVVSGFARFGGKLSRSREAPAPVTSQETLNERPMDELKFIECSQPIPAQRGSLLSHPGGGSFTSSSEEEDPSFPQRSVLASQRVNAEDVMAVSLSCAARLARHHNDLSTRLSHLQIDSDLSVRAAMEGISEVMEALSNLKHKQKRNPGSRRHSNTAPISLPVFSHPLMDPENGV